MSDLPVEAVEAAVHAIAASTAERRQIFADSVAIKAGLAAALPHLRAQVLAEVDAALRDQVRFLAWHTRNRPHDGTTAEISAHYLRDTLTPDQED